MKISIKDLRLISSRGQSLSCSNTSVLQQRQGQDSEKISINDYNSRHSHQPRSSVIKCFLTGLFPDNPLTALSIRTLQKLISFYFCP